MDRPSRAGTEPRRAGRRTTAALTALALSALAPSVIRRAVEAAPPVDEVSAEAATAAFEDYAGGLGLVLVEPTCVETTVARTFVCYGSVPDGSLLVATGDFTGDVAVWELLNRPPAEPREFDALQFFAAVFSMDRARLDEQGERVRPDSPAAAYLEFQRSFVAATQRLGYDVEQGYVYLTADAVRVCVTAELCSEIADLEVEHEQLLSFSIDGHPIAERLGRPGSPLLVGTTVVHLGVAYQTATGGQLAAFVGIVPGTDGLELSTAVYVAADGTQTPVDRDRSLGLVDGAVGGATEVMLAFPDAVPGGEIRFLVTPAGGGTPLAAVIPVEPFSAPGPSTPTTAPG